MYECWTNYQPAQRSLPLGGPQGGQSISEKTSWYQIMFAVVFLYHAKITHLCHKKKFISHSKSILLLMDPLVLTQEGRKAMLFNISTEVKGGKGENF